MAEIHIERTARPAWPWVLLVLALLAALAWWLLASDRTGGAADGDVAAAGDTSPVQARRADDPGTATVGGAPAAVNDYLRWVGSTSARRLEGGAVREHAAEGLRRLADALGDMTGADSLAGRPLPPRLDTLRARAANLAVLGDDARGAAEARAGFVDAGDILVALRRSSYPAADAEAAAAREAAMAVDGTRPLAQQGDAVQRFLDRAGAALEAMLAPTGS